MRKAVPKPTRPRGACCAPPPEPWEREIDNYDRSVRRRNRAFRSRVVRIDHEYVGLIVSDRTLPQLSRLNELEPENESFRSHRGLSGIDLM